MNNTQSIVPVSNYCCCITNHFKFQWLNTTIIQFMILEPADQALLGSFSAVFSHVAVATCRSVLSVFGRLSHISRASAGTTELTQLWSTQSHILQQPSLDLLTWPRQESQQNKQVETEKTSKSLGSELVHHHFCHITLVKTKL